MSAYELWRTEVDNRAIARDGFNRTASSGWGAADTGQAWTNTGGSASDYSVGSGVGSISNGTVAVSRIVTAGDLTTTDMQISATVTIPVLALTNYIAAILMVRFTDANNYYYLFVKCMTDGQVDLDLSKVVGGVDSSITSRTDVSTYVPGARLKMALQVSGTTLRGKVWRVGTTTEPDWQLTTTDRSLTAGQFGVQNYLGTGNTNTAPVLTHDDVAVDYVAEHWVDITSSVDTMRSPIRATNGQTAETTGDTGAFELVLHNPGFEFTPDNPMSLSALASGMGIRFFEVIGYDRIDHFRGFIDFPEATDVNLSMTQSQTLQVFAVDQLSHWENSQTFVSTLGAHIMGSARNGALVGYWPLNDPGPTFAPAVGGIVGVITDPNRQGAALTQPVELNFQSGGAPPGDDTNCVDIVYGFNGSTNTNGPYVDITFPSTPTDLRVPLAAGKVATVVVWFDMTSTTNVTLDGLSLTINALTGGIYLVSRAADALGAHWHGSYFNGSFYTVDAPNGSANATSRWYAVAARWGFSPNVIELWVDDGQYTGTFTEAVTTAYISQVLPSVYGSVAHVQLYIGDPTDFTFADFTAQREVGLRGLERQTTGARIRTIAGYAGKTAAELDQVDDGASVMQIARLSGLTVAQAMYEARDTERGDLYIDGVGKTTFDDRRTLLNI